VAGVPPAFAQIVAADTAASTETEIMLSDEIVDERL